MRKQLQNTICRRVLSCLLLSFAMTFIFVGCGRVKEERRTKELSKLKEITLALDWTANTNHTGLFVAQEKGYFEEEGLDVTIVMPQEDGATAMVADGTADVGIAFQNQLAEDFANNTALPVTAIAAIYQHNQDGLLSLQSKDISTPLNLMDQSYATAEDVIEHSIVRTVVEMDGGDFARVELIPSYVDDPLETLNDSGIGAIWGSYGWEGLSCVLQGYAVNFIPFADQNENFDYYSVLLIANNSFLKKQPEIAKAFMKAVSRGYEFAVINPKEAADILLQENPDLDAKLVHASQNYVSGKYFADTKRFGTIDAERWNRFFTWVNEKQLLKNQIPENIGFSNDYLAEPSTALPSPTSEALTDISFPDDESSNMDESTDPPAEDNTDAGVSPSPAGNNAGNSAGGNSIKQENPAKSKTEDSSQKKKQNSKDGEKILPFWEDQSGDDVEDETKPNGY